MHIRTVSAVLALTIASLAGAAGIATAGENVGLLNGTQVYVPNGCDGPLSPTGTKSQCIVGGVLGLDR